jgi:hypothetical protein
VHNVVEYTEKKLEDSDFTQKGGARYSSQGRAPKPGLESFIIWYYRDYCPKMAGSRNFAEFLQLEVRVIVIQIAVQTNPVFLNSRNVQ